MKSMSCKQLGGACDIMFSGETFEDIAVQSKEHGMEMFQKGDIGHLKAMKTMKNRMQTTEDFNKWMEDKRKEFDALPEEG
ncbi:DUF1059 domain-containing protein [Muriicola sp. E247]|uniref:DUF1059 domain-containing protein n=1 Tax=Muriicola sp. E247 TaxID=3242730 RepID=UPI0035259C58